MTYLDDKTIEDRIEFITQMPGVLKLSSRYIKTCKTKGYIMKEFDPAFGNLPRFMVKTNRIKESHDMYVVVDVSHKTSINGKQSIEGTINRYIGKVGDHEAELELCKIIGTCHWKRKINREIDDSKNGITEKDLTPKRLDLSKDGFKIISIDPEGSEDIDDALSITKVTDNKYMIGIHIADPSSYIVENGKVDIEVSKRSESLYLQDVTCHMFPEKLSTNVFSLKQGKVSRAFTVFVTFELVNSSWKIVSTNISKTLIRVTHNTTYEAFQKEYKEDSLFNIMYSIGEFLHNKSSKIQKDQDTYSSKQMIAQYMILANCTVAETLVKLAHTKEQQNKIIVRTQELSDVKVSKESKEKVDSILLDLHQRLRAQRAEIKIYNEEDSDQNRHAGLDLNLYTHFTSPIRRYSDILVHRLLYDLINNTTIFECTNINQGILNHLNYYKKFYRRVSELEQDILVTHKVVKTIGKDPNNRVLEMSGTIIDINVNAQDKNCLLKVLCIGIINQTDHEDEFNLDILNNISDHFKNQVHTIRITNFDVDGYKNIDLFAKIQYKLCFLNRDVRKIRAYL